MIMVENVSEFLHEDVSVIPTMCPAAACQNYSLGTLLEKFQECLEVMEVLSGEVGKDHYIQGSVRRHVVPSRY